MQAGRPARPALAGEAGKPEPPVPLPGRLTLPLRSKRKRDRIGGPGASHEDRRHPERSRPRRPAPEPTKSTRHSGVSGGASLTGTILTTRGGKKSD